MHHFTNELSQVSRSIAHEINPIISETDTVDTLTTIASLIEDFGYLISVFEGKTPGGFQKFYTLTQAISAAINYEIFYPTPKMPKHS